jgi:hypothetical protein
VTNRESNVDVHLNNNYCFRCRLPNVADAKSLDRCIRQFDDLLLKFHHLKGRRRREKSFSIKNESPSGWKAHAYLEFERFDESFLML